MSRKVVLGPNSQLNKKQVAGLIALYSQYHFRVGTIAKLYGIAATTATRILARNGCLKPVRFSFSENQRQVIVNLYKQGYNLSDIGQMFNTSRWTIKKALHLEGQRTRVEMKQHS